MTTPLSVLAAGDIFIGGPDDYPRIHNVVPMTKKRDDLYSWLEHIAPVLRAGTFTLGNLEGPICEGGEIDIGKAGTGGAVFRMPPSAADALKRAGLDAVALANNHTMDLGAGGLVQTIENLDGAGVAWSGGGRNIAEARRPAILESDGIRLAFLSYTSSFIPGTFPAGPNKPGLATVAVSTAYEIPGSIRYAPGVPPKIVTTADRREADQMCSDVRTAKAQADLVVVSWHWGLTRYANSFGMGIAIDEAPFFVLGYQEDMGRAAIDAGADLVMGHHPHRLQGFEVYKGRLICYSLCNLAISFGEGPNFGPESVIAKAIIDPRTKRFSRFSLIPIVLPHETMEPRLVRAADAGEYVGMLTQLSRKYRTSFRLDDGELVVEAP